MALDYLPGQTLLQRLDVRTKIMGFGGIVILSFLFENPAYNLVIALLVGFMAFSIRMPLKKVLSLLVPLIPIFIFIMLISGFTYPPGRFDREVSQTILFYLWPGERLGVTAGGILLGFTFLIRLFILVLASSVLTATTPLDDFIQFLAKMRVPYEVSFMITTAIRFIPTIDKKRMLILEAQKARGANLTEKGMIGRLKAHIPIMIPLIINSILMANSLSMAMLNRGFGYTRSCTNMREIAFARRDYIALCLIIMVTGLGLYLRLGLDWGVL